MKSADRKRDERIRKALRESAPSMPKDMSERFDATLRELAEQKRPRRRGRVLRPVIVGAITAFVMVFFLLPNMSADVSYAMQELPLIGGIVRVTTVYKKQAESEKHFEDITTPKLEGSEELKNPTDQINEDVEKLTAKVMEEYESGIEGMPDAHTGLVIDYQILTNNDQWFTMKLMIYYAAGSSTVEYRFYHIDKESGQLVTLSDLFSEDYDYETVFSENVKEQMRQRMADDANQIYWIYPEAEYDWGFERIDPDQNFYFDDQGNLVLVFDKYEVAPGYMGTPEFTIQKDLWEGHLNE